MASAQQLAHHLGSATGPALAAAANHAFFSGIRAAMLLGAGFCAVSIVMVPRVVPDRKPQLVPDLAAD